MENEAMGRPKKSETGPIPTNERLLQQAMELFAERGFDSVAVRDITRPLGLTEATLYIHYKNKADLLETIFERLEQNLISPAFSVPPPESFLGEEELDVGEYLIAGAKRFFARADRETVLTWRILMVSQYRYASARTRVEADLLDAPCRYFAGLLASMMAAGKIRGDADTESMGRVIAAVFFQYSFRTNLQAAWEGAHSGEFERLENEIKSVARSLQS